MCRAVQGDTGVHPRYSELTSMLPEHEEFMEGVRWHIESSTAPRPGPKVTNGALETP